MTKEKAKFVGRFSIAFANYLGEAYTYSKRLSLRKGLLWFPAERLEVTSVGKFRRTLMMAPDHLTLAVWARQGTQRSECFKELSNELRNCRAISKHFMSTPSAKHNYDVLQPFQVIQDALAYYLSRKRAWRTDYRIIKGIASSIYDHFAMPFLEIKFLCFLENLIYNGEALSGSVGSGVRIKSVADKEIVEFYNNSRSFRDLYYGPWITTLNRVQSALELLTKIPKGTKSISDNFPDDREAATRFDNIITTIQFISPSQINRSPVLRISKRLPFFNHDLCFGINYFQRYDSMLQLNREHLGNIRKLSTKLTATLKAEPMLASVITRLRMLNNRSVFDDKVVDGFIILEYILRICTTEGFGLRSTSREMALVSAKLSGPTEADREFVFDTVRSAYRIRNRIVHANRPTKREQDVIRKFERVLRHILHQLITTSPIPRKSLKDWLLE